MPYKARCSLYQNLWLTPPWKEQRPCSSSILWKRGSPFSLLLTSMPDLTMKLFILGQRPNSPAQRPGNQKGGKKRGFPASWLQHLLQVPEDPWGKGRAPSLLSVSHSIKYRSCSAEPRTGLGIHKAQLSAHRALTDMTPRQAGSCRQV